MLRVISGSAKGRRLKSVPGLATRPTADRVRQTIFDMLGDISDERVLDLFAGTGALGIEALSRGAATAVFVETAPAALAVIKHNLELVGLAGEAKVLKADAEQFISRRSKTPASSGFDLLFLDPPYERGLAFVARILERLVSGGWISDGGTVVVEAATGELELPAGLREIRARQFGGTKVFILKTESS